MQATSHPSQSSLTAKVLGLTLNHTLHMGFSYGSGYLLGWLRNVPSPKTIASVAALSSPLDRAFSYSLSKVAAIDDSSWKNLTAKLASNTASTLAASAAYRSLGYEINPLEMHCLISVAVQRAALPYFQKLTGGCTSLRDLATSSIVMLTSTVASTLACMQLGYDMDFQKVTILNNEIEVPVVVQKQAVGLLLSTVVTSVVIGLSRIAKEIEKEEDRQNISSPSTSDLPNEKGPTIATRD